MKRTATKDIAYGEDPLQKLDVFPASKPGAPVVIFWHGGGWQHDDKRRYGFVGRFLQRAGYTAVIANYRLHPQVKFPVFNEDAAAAAAWVYQHVGDYNGDPQWIFLMGHSAGAHVAVFAAYSDRWLKAAKVPRQVIRGFIGLAGPYDFYPVERYRSVFDLTDKSEPWRPINQVDHPDVPALLLHGRFDMIVEPGNSRRFAAYLNGHGGKAQLKIYYYLEHFSIIAALAWPLAWLPLRRTIRRFLKQNS